MRIIIQNGLCVDPVTQRVAKQAIYIADGKIIALDACEGFEAERIIDATHHVVIPGMVDLRVALREPGQAYKATIASETKAAAKAGITTVCCWPDTCPVIDTPAVVELIAQRAQAAGFAKVKTLGALTIGLKGEQLAEMAALKAAGCVGITNGNYPILQTDILMHAFEYAATHDLTVFICPEDYWLARNGCIHEGSISTRLGITGIPVIAETLALATHLQLVEYTGARAHFSQLSSKGSVELLAIAKDKGLPVTADVAAYQLFLSEKDMVDFDSNYHLRPPLRHPNDQHALIEGVRKNIIDAICSHHQPHEEDAKLKPFPLSESGMSALETLLPLSLRLIQKEISLLDVITKLTLNPAKILGSKAGSLSVGQEADMCIFNPEQNFFLTKNYLYSQGLNTPFLNSEMKGQVLMTLLNGEIVFESH